MKEGLIASSYECPKCNDRHDVTWSAIKRFLRNRISHTEADKGVDGVVPTLISVFKAHRTRGDKDQWMNSIMPATFKQK
ncbi:hypothetical protein TNCV_4855781 [Trichonephila clavipes]|nr:hypothetical protein TNCV_4855781 [Trichonephila clavipes]